jgi:hypothetical protein
VLRRAIAPLFALCCALLPAAAARAETLVIESHAGPRATHPAVQALRRELAGLEPSIAEASAVPRLRTAVPLGAPTTAALPATFTEDVERGHRAWIKGQFANAIATLTPLVAQALAHPLAMIDDPAITTSAHKAMADLALAYQRSAAAADAGATMAELIRTFPTRPLTRAVHGPLGMELFEQTAGELQRAATATLTVRGDAAASYWLNERPVTVGATLSVAPGPYRLLARRGDDARLATIDLAPGSRQTVLFDLQAAAALQLDAGLVVLAQVTGDDATALAGRLAATLAPIDLIHLRVVDARTVSATWTSADGTARAAALSTPDQAEAVARYLLRGERDTSIEVLPSGGTDADATGAPRASRGGSMSPWKWLIGGLGLAAGGVGGYFLYIDGSCAGELVGGNMCNRLHDTRDLGLGVAAGGGALVLTSLVMLIVDARRAAPGPRKVVPVVSVGGGGALAGLVGQF